jgi:hypothetical protein
MKPKKIKTLKKLPKPKSNMGYTSREIDSICGDLGIRPRDFWCAFGVNTCALVRGVIYYYKRDVELALYKLGCKLGVNHPWD